MRASALENLINNKITMSVESIPKIWTKTLNDKSTCDGIKRK